ncbi:MAG: hypothetical protein WD993_00690 [Thermoleophilaceae bacterium]
MKDRERQIYLEDGQSRIVVRRSSTHPVEYAITLITRHDGRDHAVRTFDNAHDVEEHHEHRYIGSEKQPPSIVRRSVNDAMKRAEEALLAHWRAYVDEWKQTIR